MCVWGGGGVEVEVEVNCEVCDVCSEFKMGSAVEDQQVSCLWQGPHLLSVSLSGFINYLDVNNPTKPLRVLKVRHRALQLCSYN